MKKKYIYITITILICILFAFIGSLLIIEHDKKMERERLEEESRKKVEEKKEEKEYLDISLYSENVLLGNAKNIWSFMQGFYITDIGTDTEIIWYSYKDKYDSDKMNIVGYRKDEMIYKQVLQGAGHGQNFVINKNSYGRYGIVSGSYGTEVINNHYASYGISIVPDLLFDGKIIDLRSSGVNFGYYTAAFNVYKDRLVAINGNGIRIHHYPSMELLDYFKIEGIEGPIQGTALWENYLYVISGLGPRLINTQDDAHLYKIDLNEKKILNDSLLFVSSNWEPEGLNVVLIDGKPNIFFGAMNYSKMGAIQIWKVDESL